MKPPRRRGELVDDDRDKRPQTDDTPETPPTEPQPVPVKEPPRPADKDRPYYVAGANGTQIVTEPEGAALPPEEAPEDSSDAE